MSTGTQQTGVWQTLREEAGFLDLLLLFSVPVVLLGPMTLSRAIRVSLAFEYTNPSLWTAFASSFVHLNAGHLLLNLVAYSLVVTIALSLSLLSGTRRRFRIAFVTLVVVSPFLLPYLNLAILRRSLSVGFSGVLMALYGYLPFALAAYLQSQFDIGDRRNTAPLVFFVGLAIITGLVLGAVFSHPVSVPIKGQIVPVRPVLVGTLASLLLALMLVVLLYSLSLSDGWNDLRRRIVAGLGVPGYAEMGVAAVGVFLAVPVAIFPIDPIINESVVNIYSHLVGYGLGFSATYATAILEGRLFE